MTRHGLRIAGAAVVLLANLMGIAAAAAGSGRMTLDQLADKSDAIVYARVIGLHSHWDFGTRAIWTRTDLQILEAPKGNPGSLLSITEPGGILPGRGEIYPGIPQFRAGQEVVLFLYRAPGNRLRITGLLRGVYLVSADVASGVRVARPALASPEAVYEEGSPSAPVIRQSAEQPEALHHFLMFLREKGKTR